ncbi:MAG TPA: hypothetical protein VHE81_12575, partial [Lacipirellulaceae bacterium]|nr:hypothetical protein [Lacipirellulaceae bacterium]
STDGLPERPAVVTRALSNGVVAAVLQRTGKKDVRATYWARERLGGAEALSSLPPGRRLVELAWSSCGRARPQLLSLIHIH